MEREGEGRDRGESEYIGGRQCHHIPTIYLTSKKNAW